MPSNVEAPSLKHIYWGRIANAVICSVVAASAIQIRYFRSLPSSNDLLNSIWRVVICGQVVQVTSIMTSTIPFLKPFLLSLKSGFLIANKAARSTTSAYSTSTHTGHPLSYIKISSQNDRDRPKRAGDNRNIWVTKKVVIKQESSAAQVA